MKLFRNILEGLAFILMLLSVIGINVAWLMFVILLAGKVLQLVSYPWFLLSISSLSVIGTPLILMISSLASFFMFIIFMYLSDNLR
jgi:hypothetical protein